MDIEKILSEVSYKAVRSSGAGGQNVNKVSSKVVLSFDVAASQSFSEEEKELVLINLSSRLNSENILILNCDEDRSQLRNKEIVTKRLLNMLEKSLIIPKKRKKTKVPKSVIRKRIKDKKTLSERKALRKKPDF